MAGSGAVAWMFKFRGQITVRREAADEDRLMELALEGGAEDFEVGEEFYSITSAPEDFGRLCKVLEEAGVERLSADGARRVVRLMGELEDNDDVNSVYANFEMTAELAAALVEEE